MPFIFKKDKSYFFILLLLASCATLNSGIQNKDAELAAHIQILNEWLQEKEGITSIAIAPDGGELFFTKSIGRWAIDDLKSNLYYQKKEKGVWTSPKLAPFAGGFNNSNPSFSPNGQALYFISKRPTSDGDTSANIWKVEKNNYGLGISDRGKRSQ